MVKKRRPRGLVDTSVVIDLWRLPMDDLPEEIVVSAVTMAELAAAPHATMDALERAARQDRLQRAEALFDAVPVDSRVARAYGRLYAAVIAAGRKARGQRALDLLIGATALVEELPLYTRNPNDFVEVGVFIDVVAVP